MFKGNAKTHFQSLGKSNSNSIGFMMSPFGDERWDADDRDKLRKIFKKTDLAGFVRGSESADGNRLKTSSPANLAVRPDATRIHQQPTLQPQANQQSFGVSQEVPLQQIQQFSTPQDADPRREVSVYKPAEVKGNRAPNADTKPRTMHSNFGSQNRGEMGATTICKDCHDKMSTGNYSHMKETRSDIFVASNNKAGYIPFEPMQGLPQWAFQPKDESVYVPLG